mmetsp:Transcript_41034/g.47184  ORF Transcript_41034/g.47184 Transcript_41034/m.47184 type:complete len:178 (-) Transcript_41034:27-560(-)
MTLVDRIFTRIGASDRILENKSTFFVEMEETKAIVEQSTPSSLVIMDELGRGTSTFDGYSIAHAVLSYQTTKNQCMTMFTTHYHMLIDSFRDNKEVQPMKMSFEVDENNGDVKFLYKFVKGYSMESQGIYIAKMAKIPQSIIERAKQQSSLFKEKLALLEQKCKIRSKSKEEIKDME